MNRVEYDLTNSEYYAKVDKYIFYFSSEFNKNRFLEGYINFSINETNKLKARYHVGISINDYLLIVFYKKIEKRGFRVLTYCEDDIIELDSDYIFRM